MKKVPPVPSYFGTRGIFHFKKIAKILIGVEKLKSIHVPALELMAVNLEQWEFAVKEIRKKNKSNLGSGYIQTFGTGAKQISVEVTLKRDAEKAILQCFKQFGLDPKSEKELSAAIDPAQGDLFNGFQEKRSSL